MSEKPLADVRVVNTRASHQAARLTELLAEQGADVLHYPTITIAPMPDTGPLDEALRQAADGAFDWLVFTSTNSVRMVGERLDHLGIDPARLGGPKVAAVGSSTARAITDELGLHVHLVPDKYSAESLAATLDVAVGQRIFLPQSAIARPLLAESLRAAGAEVTAVDAYRTLMGSGGVDLPERFWEGSVDAVLFTSASTVHNFMRRLKFENGSAAMLIDVVVGCIGPVTTKAARAHELPVRVVPEEHTLEGLVAALAKHFATGGR